jgi:DNA adenine methylase
MKAKPFIKWVGGKGQLIEQLEALLPADFDKWENVTYIEPFVGGGAMLFYMLQRHSNIKSAVINDINEDLTTCYKVVRDNPKELVDSLAEIQKEYYLFHSEDLRKKFFMLMRDEFNTKSLAPIRNTTLFFFLNRTCFNGLYRVNKSGLFNVPFGKYETPTICDPVTIYADSEVLQNVEIMTGDYQKTFKKAQGNTLFYFDPPYRPLSNTSSFNDYAKEAFNDLAQARLKKFCDRIEKAGYSFMLSNSDCFNTPLRDRFFEDLYLEYIIDRVWASRNINANPSKRGKLTEILVHNYAATKAHPNVEYAQVEMEPMYAAEEVETYNAVVL